MKRAKFWTRIKRNKSEEWLLVEGDDPSRVPLKAWKAYNKAFWDWKSKGAFFPVDDFEAYQIGVGEMIRTAENPPELRRATLSTYLVSSAYLALCKHKSRTVDPARQEYRQLFEQCIVAENSSDATRSDVRSFVEALPGVHSAEAMMSAYLAAACVYETFAKLDEDARRGLEAWLEADGIWIDAAKIYNPNGSVQGYVYRFKAKWAPAFREACEWIW